MNKKTPIEAMAEQYLDIPCSVMSPNRYRLDLLSEMIDAFQVDRVVDLTWHACHTYDTESVAVERFNRERFGLTFLHLETDYLQTDTEQLRTLRF